MVRSNKKNFGIIAIIARMSKVLNLLLICLFFFKINNQNLEIRNPFRQINKSESNIKLNAILLTSNKYLASISFDTKNLIVQENEMIEDIYKILSIKNDEIKILNLKTNQEKKIHI